MAEITLLTPEQLAEREQKAQRHGRRGRRRSAERTRIIEEYKAAMQGVEPGYEADVLLAAGDDKQTTRQNLKAAAAELGHRIQFRQLKDPPAVPVHHPGGTSCCAEAQWTAHNPAGRGPIRRARRITSPI